MKRRHRAKPLVEAELAKARDPALLRIWGLCDNVPEGVSQTAQSGQQGPEGPCEINRPAHYVRPGTIEPIDFIESQGLPYHLGNVVKYITRFRHKGTPLKDLKKARWFLDRYIAYYEEGCGDDAKGGHLHGGGGEAGRG